MSMSNSFSFPRLNPEEIVGPMHTYSIAPTSTLCTQDLVQPQLGFLAEVFALFLAAYVGDDSDEQLQFHTLQVLENPEHHMRALQISWIYKRADTLD